MNVGWPASASTITQQACQRPSLQQVSKGCCGSEWYTCTTIIPTGRRVSTYRPRWAVVRIGEQMSENSLSSHWCQPYSSTWSAFTFAFWNSTICPVLDHLLFNTYWKNQKWLYQDTLIKHINCGHAKFGPWLEQNICLQWIVLTKNTLYSENKQQSSILLTKERISMFSSQCLLQGRCPGPGHKLRSTTLTMFALRSNLRRI